MSESSPSHRYARLAAARRALTGPGGQFEITREMVLNRSNLVFRHAPTNVREVWLATRQFEDLPYLVYGDQQISYAEAHRRVDAIAAWLAARGIVKGDRVGISMRNFPEWMLIYWACLATGITAVGFNAWWTAEEMAYALADSVPKVLFVDDERMDRALTALPASPKTEVVCLRNNACPASVIAWSDVLAGGGAMPDATIEPDHDACIFYTSGTTGSPKGAQLTHRGCVATLFNQMFSAAATALASNQPSSEPPSRPTVLVTTPLFHVTANNCAVYPVTAAGGKVVLMHRWDPTEALRLIATEKVTRMSGVPLMTRELIQHPDFGTTDTSSLLAMSGGGAQVPPDLVLQVAALNIAAKPSTGYGMTETSGVVTSVTGEFFVAKPDSAGPILPNYEAKCIDDSGCEVEPGEIGELWVRGSSIIKGYLNAPEATVEAIVDGWLRTGDIARIDEDGFLFIVDRKKDMVLRGGENVYCSEVESALYRCPEVAECCVFSVPDERLGEDVGAAVYLKSGSHIEASKLRQDCSRYLARHKLPRYIWFLAEPLPRNANGKFLKRDLRERLKLEDAAT